MGQMRRRACPLPSPLPIVVVAHKTREEGERRRSSEDTGSNVPYMVRLERVCARASERERER